MLCPSPGLTKHWVMLGQCSNTNLSKHLPELRGHTWSVPGTRAGTRALQDPVAAFGADPTGTCPNGGIPQRTAVSHTPSFTSPIPASLPSSGTCLPPTLSPNMTPHDC